MGKKIYNYIICITLFIILILPTIFMNKKKNVISKTENRQLVTFPQLLDDNGKVIPNFKNSLIAWFNDNLGLRSQLVSLNSKIQYHLLNKSPSKKVEIGKNGWFFYTLDNNIEIAKGTYPNFDENMLKQICEQQKIIQKKLADQGREYVLVLTASKASIYPEMIASGDYNISRTPADILADYLEENSDIHVVRVKDALLEEKEKHPLHPLYFKTDTHWNELGAYIGYKKIIEDLNKWGGCMTPSANVSFDVGSHKGEFSAMMNNVSLLPEESCPKSVIQNPVAMKIPNEEDYNLIQLLHDRNNYRIFHHFKNNNVPLKKCLMFSDSLFAGWNMPELFSENFSEFTYIWSWDIYQSQIDFLDPDIVIYTLGERYLNHLCENNTFFIQNKLNSPKAEILNYKIDNDEVSVIVKNVGFENWTSNDLIRLGVWKDDKDSGYRINIPNGKTIKPGETFEFISSDFPFDVQKEKNLKFQMLQEGIQYFGERELINGPLKQFPKPVKSNELNAEIVSNTAPQKITRGQNYTIKISVKNTSSQTWSKDNNIRLCIFQDGTDWGYRLDLPNNKKVAPGDCYTFTLENFVAPPNDTTYLEFQMLQEGVLYFGEKERVDIEVN